MNWGDQLSAWLSTLENDPEQLQVVFVFALAVFAFASSLGVAMFVRALFNPVQKRIDIAQQSDVATQHEEAPKYGLLRQLGSVIAPKAEDKKASMVQRLEMAGYRSPQAFTVFFGIKLLGFVLAPFIALFGMVLLGPGQIVDQLVNLILLAVLAFLLPDFWLMRAVRRRQKHLRHALPDALDMMVVCAEAGLGLNAAIQRVADEIGVQHPELAEEFKLVMLQTRAGMDSRTALKELQRRTGLDDIRAFVATILQALRFGTSISDSLRVFSEDMRDKRLQRAQEIAARLSLTMLMPIALCMMPMFLLIAMGPALFILKNLSRNIGG